MKPMPVHFYMYQKNADSAIKQAVDTIIKHYGRDKTILFLGRVNSEYDKLLETNLFSIGNKTKDGTKTLVYRDYPYVPMEYMTIHASKGKEKDNVIILNFNNALLGIPNKISDDPILELVLSTSDTYRYGEERRLLYVAMTRTKNEVFLITSQSRPSEFLQDFDEDQYSEQVPVDYTEGKSINCPWCKTGKLIERDGKFGKFVGCTNSSGLGGNHSYVTFFSGLGVYSSSYLRMNDLNDFTITISRTGNSYAVNAFVNGTLVKSDTATNSNHFNFTKFYLNYLRGTSNSTSNSLSYHDNRGIAQLAIYSGVKYTGNYTPTYALLKKTV